MGLLHSTDRGPRAAPQPPTVLIGARCDQITDDLLARVAEARTQGALRAVTIDCRRSPFDEEAVDRVYSAAGGKLVLDL